MGAESKIEWCDHTFNGWIGCTKVSPGCANCYAETLDRNRFSKTLGDGTKEAPVSHWGPGAPRHRTSASNWKQFHKWNERAYRFASCTVCDFRGDAKGRCSGPEPDGPWVIHCPNCDTRGALRVTRPRVFCSSLSDWMDPEVPTQWRLDLFDLWRRCENLDILALTKRPELWEELICSAWRLSVDIHGSDHPMSLWLFAWLDGIPPSNVWIGTTVEDQARAEQRIPALLKIPAVVRFLSCEPLLGPVNLDFGAPRFRTAESYHAEIHWVICGGESGPGARPMHPDWADHEPDSTDPEDTGPGLLQQCRAAGVPFLFKQFGEWVPSGMVEDETKFPTTVLNGTIMCRIGKKAAGRRLRGREHNEFPEVQS